MAIVLILVTLNFFLGMFILPLSSFTLEPYNLLNVNYILKRFVFRQSEKKRFLNLFLYLS